MRDHWLGMRDGRYAWVKQAVAWYACHPCGGALTVRREEAGAQTLTEY